MLSFWAIDLCSIEAYQQLAGKRGSKLWAGLVAACSIESRHALNGNGLPVQRTISGMLLLRIYQLSSSEREQPHVLRWNSTILSHLRQPYGFRLKCGCEVQDAFRGHEKNAHLGALDSIYV